MPDRKWGESEDDGYSPDKFYIGGTDDKGHGRQARDIRIQPWLMDIMQRLAQEIPGYKKQIGNVARDCFTHWTKYRISTLDDPRLREELMKEFQLHADMEEEARLVNRFSEMETYVARTGTALRVYAEAEQWMLISQRLERMRKRLQDGLLWEPHAGEVRGMIAEYEKKLSNAKKKT